MNLGSSSCPSGAAILAGKRTGSVWAAAALPKASANRRMSLHDIDVFLRTTAATQRAAGLSPAIASPIGPFDRRCRFGPADRSARIAPGQQLASPNG